MTGLLVIMYIVSAATVLAGAAAAVRRAVKHGATLGGLDALVQDILNPRKAWRDFGLVALGLIVGTVADIISVLGG